MARHDSKYKINVAPYYEHLQKYYYKVPLPRLIWEGLTQTMHNCIVLCYKQRNNFSKNGIKKVLQNKEMNNCKHSEFTHKPRYNDFNLHKHNL